MKFNKYTNKKILYQIVILKSMLKIVIYLVYNKILIKIYAYFLISININKFHRMRSIKDYSLTGQDSVY